MGPEADETLLVYFRDRLLCSYQLLRKKGNDISALCRFKTKDNTTLCFKRERNLLGFGIGLFRLVERCHVLFIELLRITGSKSITKSLICFIWVKNDSLSYPPPLMEDLKSTRTF